jgi:hypothetical protein
MQEICFVVMPFSETTKEHTEDYWTKHFDSFLKPLIEENPNLEAHRSEPLRGNILNQIIMNLVISRVVVADLTDHNPNVYWELGVRQSFKHGTITIAEVGTKLPFDVGGTGIHFYHPKDHLKNEDFRKNFKMAIHDCLVNPEKPDSHVLEALSGRGTLFEIFHRDEAIRRLDAVILEYNLNSYVLEEITGQAQTNLKNRLRIYTHHKPGRFVVGAVELLAVNRYLDEDTSFYESVEIYLQNLTRTNEMLNFWVSNPKGADTWLLETHKTLVDSFAGFKTRIDSAREKLLKRS